MGFIQQLTVNESSIGTLKVMFPLNSVVFSEVLYK